jgi:hypothetical protein
MLENADIFSLWLLRLFLFLLSLPLFWNAPRLFFQRHGQSHRILGGVYLGWIIWGVSTCDNVAFTSAFDSFLYDFILGCLGITTTLTAARDFPHKFVKNARGQSGSLAETAIVTQAEMMEHGYYQILNLIQSIYLHGLAWKTTSLTIFHRLFALVLMTSPWLIRSRFPVHSFSANWRLTPLSERTQFETFLYRIKKAQYMLYKHFVLHGLNISIALKPSTLPRRRYWRIFWLHLNTSYVMEFFLQSLVKRRIIQQKQMISLQQLLMLSSTISALNPILAAVDLPLSMLSLILNIVHRHHDLENTIFVAILGTSILYLRPDNDSV